MGFKVPRTKKRKTKKTKAPASTKKLVTAVAKKVIADALEDKYAILSPGNTGGVPSYFNALIANNLDCYPLMPMIKQGTNSNERVGDKIRPKHMRVSFVITANGSYVSSQLNQIRLFILQDKGIHYTPNIRYIPTVSAGTPIATELMDLAGTVGGFLGEPVDIMRRVNRQRYHVFHDRVFEVCAGKGQTPQPSNSFTGDQIFVSNQQCFKVTFRIATPAVFKYSNPSDVYPTNFAPFFCLGYVQPDGNATPDNLLTRIACNWYTQLDYEDA